MLEVYSKDVNVASETPIPLNNVAISSCCAAKLVGSNTITLAKPGVSRVVVNAVATASSAGEVSIQLMKNGVLLPQAFSAVTAADTTSLHPLSFETFVKVGPCPCALPVSIEVINSGVASNFSVVDVLVA